MDIADLVTIESTMASFRCVCGEKISTSGVIPNPTEWRVIPDGEWDRLLGQPVDLTEVYVRAPIAYRCPRSDHLWIYWDGFDAAPSLYSPTSF